MRHQYLVFRTYYVTILMSFSYMHWFALRYAREHHSLYLQIGVNHFSEFEQLRNGLSEKFTVEQGVLVQEKKRVNSTFTLKNKTVEANHLKVTK